MCKIKDKVEAEAISALARRFVVNQTQALGSISALCVPHFMKLSAAIDDPKLLCRLWDHQATLFEQLSEDMKRFALKRDATRRFLETQEEETSAVRALYLIAGDRNVNGG